MVSIDGKKPWCLCSCSCSSFVPVILFALNGLGVVTKIKTIWQSSENGSFLWRCRVTWQPCGNNGANQLVSKEGISQISSTHLQASLPSWSTSSAEQSLFALPASTKRNGASSGPRRRLAVQSTALFHKALYLQGRSQGFEELFGLASRPASKGAWGEWETVLWEMFSDKRYRICFLFQFLVILWAFQQHLNSNNSKFLPAQNGPIFTHC